MKAVVSVLRSPWRRPLIATAVVALALVVQAAGSHIYGVTRTSPPVHDQIAQRGAADIAVSMSFPPEQFNLGYLQGMGDIVRVQGGTVYMTGVSASAVTRIAGQYWVSAVRAWNGG